jgi:truncated hemoglobin YjbI
MTTRTSPERHSVFDRVGGYDKVDRAVACLFGRIAQDPSLATLVDPASETDARWHTELLLTDVLGGPMAYDGPEPQTVAGRVGIDAAVAARLIEHAVAGFTDAGVDQTLANEIRSRLQEFASRQGLPTSAPVAARPTPGGGPDRSNESLITLAQRDLAVAGPGWRLFVLDPQLTVVHVGADAARAAVACEPDLRRAFNLGAADLLGTSILRFHSAPTQLQAALAEPARLPHETTWCFGQTVWKARFIAVLAADGTVLGYAVLWRDESDAYRNQAVFQRLRSQAEDLPVPVMFPDPALERWFGNAACEHGLERLAPHLSQPVNALDGVPISIFFPDAVRRRQLFADPERLPHKEQVRIGPETVALLVTPVRDQDQRYLGPQITWEIVHFTRPAEADRAAPAPEPSAEPAVEMTSGSAPGQSLRAQARTLESATQELQTVIRLLDTAADELDGQSHVAPAAEAVPVSEAARLAEAAESAFAAARQAQPASARRGELARAVGTITGIARRTNQLALQAALLAVQEDASQAAEELREESRVFAGEFLDRLRSLSGQAQASAEALRQAKASAARLEQLRAEFSHDSGPE